MTREERLQFCKVCQNRKFDPKQGIICGVTNLPADFEVHCESFEEAPLSILTKKSETVESEVLYNIASQGKRFANYLLDRIFLLILSLIFGAILGVVLAFTYPETISFLEKHNLLFDYILGFIAGMVYYSLLEFASGRTIAKYITRTKVVNEKGEHPGFKAIFIRSLCRYIPFEAFSFLGADASGWHDKISKTRVVEI